MEVLILFTMDLGLNCNIFFYKSRGAIFVFCFIIKIFISKEVI